MHYTRPYLKLMVIILFLLGVISCQPIVDPSPFSTIPTDGGLTEEELANEPLTIGVADTVTSLDPARSTGMMAAMVHKAVHQTLVTYAPDSFEEIVPWLALSWESSDDGLVYVFHLDPEATFSNGEPVTAGDVVSSFERLLEINESSAFVIAPIERMEAVDDATVHITLTRPDAAFLTKLAAAAFSVVDCSNDDGDGTGCIGSGPYTLVTWDQEARTVELQKRSEYFGAEAQINHVIVQSVPDLEMQRQLLETREIAIALDLTAQQAEELQNDGGIRINPTLSRNLIYMETNQDPEITEPLSNRLVQEAIRLAIDYEQIVRSFGANSVSPASVLPIGFLGALDPAEKPARSLEQARELLAAAGYPDGFEAILTYPEKDEFHVLAEFIISDLSDVEIELIQNPLPIEEFNALREEGVIELALVQDTPAYLDSGYYRNFLPNGSIGSSINWTVESGNNIDEQILAISENTAQAFEPEARAAAFREMQQYLITQGPYVSLVQPEVYVGSAIYIDEFNYNPQFGIDVSKLGVLLSVGNACQQICLNCTRCSWRCWWCNCSVCR